MVPSRVGQLARNTSALFQLQILNYIFPLILLPFLTRILGLEAYGVYAFNIAVIQVATIVTDYGFNLSATYEISKNRDRPEYVNDLIGSVYFIKLILLLIVAIVVALFFMIYPKYAEYRLFMLLTIIPIAGMTFQPIWFFQGIEQMKYITIYTCLSKFSYVVLVLLFVRSADQIVRIVLANGVAQVGAAIIGWRLIKRIGYAPRIPDRGFVKKVFNDSRGFFLSRAAASTYTTAGSFYLGLLAAPSQVAIFSASEQLYKAAQNIFTPLIQSLYPFMARKPDYPVFFRTLMGAMFCCSVVCVSGYFLAPDIIKIVYGENFLGAFPVFNIFLVMLMVTIPSMMLGYPFLGALGKADLANTSVIIAGVVQIALLFFVYFFSTVTAIHVALSILFIEVIVLLLRSGYGAKYYHRQKYGVAV